MRHEREAWVRSRYLHAEHDLSPSSFVDGLSPDVSFALGALRVVGRLAVLGAVESMMGDGLTAIAHNVVAVWVPEPDIAIVEATVRYTYLDGTSTHPVPVASIFRWHGDEVIDVRIFMDAASNPAPPSA